MLKKILLLGLFIFTALSTYLYLSLKDKKTLIIPYPYSYSSEYANTLSSEIKQAEEAKILIIGDRMAKALDVYSVDISNELAKNLKEAPQIYNWSSPKEPLHRTLFKLKQLKKLPPVILYHGASTEFTEKIFSVSDKQSIIENFKTYDNEKIISLIITFPWLSKVFYKSMDFYQLSEFKENHDRLSGSQILDESEIYYRIFSYQLRDLIEYVKDRKSNLVIITTPLNLDVRPKEICSHSTSNDVVELQQEIESLIEEGRFKEAYSKANNLSEETYSNALSFYLIGKINLNLGNFQDARIDLQKATAFDCFHWRGNAVFNAIMKQTALQWQVQVIDFDQYMSSSLTKDGLFIDEIFPQAPFYKIIINDIIESIKKVISVKS